MKLLRLSEKIIQTFFESSGSSFSKVVGDSLVGSFFNSEVIKETFGKSGSLSMKPSPWKYSLGTNKTDQKYFYEHKMMKSYLIQRTSIETYGFATKEVKIFYYL